MQVEDFKRQQFKSLVKELTTDWTWANIQQLPGVEKLVRTETGRYRRDMKTTFTPKAGYTLKFELGQGTMASSCSSDKPRMVIRRRAKNQHKEDLVVQWEADHDKGLWIRIHNQFVSKPHRCLINVQEFFMDPCDVQDSEIDFMNTLYPDVFFALPYLSDWIAELPSKLRWNETKGIIR